MYMKKQQNIVILGGGTAGWMSANLLHLKLAQHSFKIRVIESPDIGIIGVGEGSTPQLKVFFDLLGISEQEWMPQCDATYKYGIRFNAWTEHKYAPNTYFHPFPANTDGQTAKAFLGATHLLRSGQAAAPHPDRYFLTNYLAAANKSPALKNDTNQSLSTSYGYHFDSYKLGAYLKRFGQQQGIETISTTIASANAEHGNILSLTTTTGEVICGDWFFDCSGFNSLLLQKTLNVPFESFADSLFNDCAIATPTSCKSHELGQTEATALAAGWAWRIPLQSRVGNGYVFSSKYKSFNDAESEFCEHLNLNPKETSFRRIKMQVGQVAKHWSGNCVGVGLAQGFIEPLEATALHLVQETVTQFIGAFIAGEFSTRHQTQFNQVIKNRFLGIKDYITGHYVLNGRYSSEYWQDCRSQAKHTPALAKIIDCWQSNGDLQQHLQDNGLAAYYPTISWYCLLSGYHTYRKADLELWQNDNKDLRTIEQFLQDQCALFA